VGLILAVAEAHAADVVRALRESGEPLAIPVGEIGAGSRGVEYVD